MFMQKKFKYEVNHKNIYKLKEVFWQTFLRKYILFIRVATRPKNR